MKHILKIYFINTVSLYVTGQLLPFFSIHTHLQSLLISGAVLSVLMLLLKPILKILFIPVNIMTFGLLSWVSTVVLIYIFTLIDTTILITTWNFPGLSFQGFVIPEFIFSYILSLIATTFTLTLISNILYEISD